MELGGQEEEIGMPISVSYGPIHESSKLKILTPGGNGAAASDEQQQQVQQAAARKSVRYRECMKNHAASIGGHAIDGCGEFMPSGEEGTLEALKCAACNCHRNFHRREVEGEPPCYYCYNPRKDGRKRPAGGSPLPLALPSTSPSGVITRPSPQMIMAFGSGPTHENDQQEHDLGSLHGLHGPQMAMPIMKKRFRTKFTQEQKDKMCSFAEKLGWRIQKHDEAAVQQFCMELGVKRHVLKVFPKPATNSL